MKTKIFYRVGHNITHQGLWYDIKGKFTGFIHNKFNFCSNSKLEMDFDPEIVGYLSSVESLEDLFKWFTKDDLKKLHKENYSIHVYESKDYKRYDRFQHWVINKENSVLLCQVVIKK